MIIKSIIKNLYKSYIPHGLFDGYGGAVATPCLKKQRLALPLYPIIMSSGIWYLIISIYNKTDNHLSAILLKYQALLSSLWSIPMIQPLLVRILNVKPQKYISAKRFNELIYQILNHFSKYYYNLISSSQKKPCIIVWSVVNCNIQQWLLKCFLK